MANGEWLTQLMAGLGGAFTGAGQANERLAVEAERERLRQERELEKQRIANQRTLAANLFKSPLTGENISKFLGAGGDIQTASAARLLMPEPKATYEERPRKGGTALYKDGVFQSYIDRPPTPRPARDTGPTKEEEQIGGAWLTNWLGTGDEADRMRRSVLFNQMRRQGIPYGQIGWSLMQSESAGGRQMGQTLRNRREMQAQQDENDEFNDIEF